MSENEQNNEKRETLADIVTEMRRGTKLPGYWRTRDMNKILKYHADRIDAARECEKSQSWHHREMEELILRHEKEVAELKKQTGNAAAMREALLEIETVAGEAVENGTMELPQYSKIVDIAESALSAPARNCDRFADELDAQLAFLNEEWLISIDRETMTEQDTYEKWTDEMRTRYGRWLFAPAAERKGEGA